DFLCAGGLPALRGRHWHADRGPIPCDPRRGWFRRPGAGRRDDAFPPSTPNPVASLLRVALVPRRKVWQRAPPVMPTRYHIGARQLRGEIGAYAKRFDLLEVQTGALGTRSVISAATMRKWRKAVPPHFEFAVVAGPHLSRLLPGDPYEQDLVALLA